jgi:hypothetical protein
MTTQNIKDELDKVMENFRTKNQMEILELEGPFIQTENSGRPLKHTRISGIQNLRARR